MKIYIYLFLTFALMLGFWLPHSAMAQNNNLAILVAEMQKQIAALQAQIQTLQQQIAETGIVAEPAIEAVSTESLPEFTKTLFRGSSGEEVRKLQEYLAKDKEIYPEGLITGYFGQLTEIALKKWQIKHKIEAVGILGPQTRARFLELGKGRIQELITEGAGASGVIPPGLLTAPGIQKKIEITATTTTTTATTTVATTTPIKLPPTPGTCAASVNYCYNSDVCSQNGWYWCRNSCYATKEACLGEPYVAPVVTAIPATPAVPAVPAQPISQTSTTTVPVTPAVPAVVATTTTTTTTATVISNIQVTNITHNSATISWTTNKSTDGYIYYGLTTSYGADNQGFSNIFTIDHSVVLTGADIGGLTAATTYYFQIVAKDSAGNLTRSTGQSFTTSVSLSIPQVQGFTATVSGTSVNLSWQDVATPYNLSGSPSNMFGSFNIYRGSSADFTPTPIPSNPTNMIVQGSVLSYTDSNLAAGTYYYKITLQDKNGVVGTASQTVSATISSFVSVPAPLSMRWNWFGRTTLPTPTQNYQLAIYYPPSAIDAPASFNIYLKKPGESSFTKTNYPKSSLSKYVASSGSEASWSAYPIGNYGVPSNNIPIGEYKVYATAVDNAGVETAPTNIATGYYHPAPVVANPSNGSTQSSLLQIEISNTSSLANPRYVVSLFGANGYIWTPNAFYGSVTYGGPVLSSTNNPYTLVTNIFPGRIDPADSSPYTVSTFNIGGSATTTSNINFDTASRLAQILESLNSILNSLKLLK